jgi:hypothetical protein
MVFMTGAEGLTLTHHTWNARPGAEREFDVRYWQSLYRPEDIVHTTTTDVVPNGKWYLEWREERRGTLVGVNWTDLDQRHYTDDNGVRRVALVCDRPFGSVVSDYGDVRKVLVCAHQIHKGEVGMAVRIPALRYVRQAAIKPYIGMHERDRRRSNLAWVRFTDLATAARVSPERMRQIVANCWQFSGHLFYPDDYPPQPTDTLIDITFALDEDEIKGKVPQERSVGRAAFRSFAAEEPETLWLRRGFAATILRLLALRYMPAMQSA